MTWIGGPREGESREAYISSLVSVTDWCPPTGVGWFHSLRDCCEFGEAMYTASKLPKEEQGPFWRRHYERMLP